MESIESLGFHVIQVAFDNTTESPHSMFIKRHVVKNSGSNSSTLFAVNVPCYCDETGVRNIFNDCGPIESIKIRDRPGPFEDTEETSSVILNYIKKKSYKFKVAYITFENPDSIDIALQISSKTVLYMSTEDNPVLTGVEKWIKQYADRYPDKSVIQKEADEYMRKFDEKERIENEGLVDALEPDEEGWVTIPVKKKNSIKKVKEKSINKKTERKKRIEKELQNFYLFQQREAKRDKIATLRQQFEDDKKRIAQMQQLRKFKPFS